MDNSPKIDDAIKIVTTKTTCHGLTKISYHKYQLSSLKTKLDAFFRWIYHTLSDNESMKGEVVNQQNYLSRVWWWHIFRYFEKNVPVNLPLKFGWPIPKKLLRFRVKTLQPLEKPTAKGSGPSVAGIESLP
jgi:hypothetical protein